MYDSAEIFFVQFVQYFFGVGKYSSVPVKCSIFRIPTRRTKAGAQINHGVAGQFFLAEHLRLRNYFFTAGERAMRLLIAKSPQRWHLRKSGELCILAENNGWIRRSDQEEIDRQRGIVARRQKFALGSGKVEGAERLMKVNCPSRCAHNPGNGNAAAVGR